MKQTVPFARLTAVMLVTLLSTACSPLLTPPPAGLTPPADIYAPQVGPRPGVTTSPLRPTADAGTGVAPTVAPLPTDAGGPDATAPQTLVGPVWEWVSSSFKDGTVLAPSDPSRYTFELLDDGNALVQADCNFGAGTWEGSGEELTFGPIGTTKMACPPDSLYSAFLAQLQNAAAYNLGAEGLVIFLRDDAGTMRLRPVAVLVTPTAVALTETPIPAESPAPPPTPTPLPIVAPLPTETTAPPVPAATETLIPLPAAVVTTTALPIVTAMPATTTVSSLNGSFWKLTSLLLNGETIQPSAFRTPITMLFAADGSEISGMTGCNSYGAGFDANAVGESSFEQPALIPRIVCGGDIMAQEKAFIDALVRAQGYTVQGDELTFTDAAGNVLLMLLRQQPGSAE